MFSLLGWSLSSVGNGFCHHLQSVAAPSRWVDSRPLLSFLAGGFRTGHVIPSPSGNGGPGLPVNWSAPRPLAVRSLCVPLAHRFLFPSHFVLNEMVALRNILRTTSLESRTNSQLMNFDPAELTVTWCGFGASGRWRAFLPVVAGFLLLSCCPLSMRLILLTTPTYQGLTRHWNCVPYRCFSWKKTELQILC